MAASRARGGSGDRAAAAWSVQKRGWEIFGLAFLFRLQTWVLSPGATLKGIFKADILNIMGPSIAAAAWVWGRGRPAGAAGGLRRAGVRIHLSHAGHPERGLGGLAARSDRVVRQAVPEAERVHVLPVGGLRVRGRVARRVAQHRDIPGRGVAREPVDWPWPACCSSWRATARVYLPSLYPAGYSNFWTSSPTYYFMKIGHHAGADGAHLRLRAAPVLGPAPQPGVEPDARVRPFVALRLLDPRGACVRHLHVAASTGVCPSRWSLVAFTRSRCFMYAVTRLKSRVVSGWKARRVAAQPA